MLPRAVGSAAPRRKPNAEYRSRKHHKLANDDVDTRTIQAYLGHRVDPAYGALYRAVANSVQEPIPGLSYPGVSYLEILGKEGPICFYDKRGPYPHDLNRRWARKRCVKLL
jgi:hypothetical protein